MVVDPSRLGIYASFGSRMPFKDRLPLIREAGFGVTGIWWEEKRDDIRAIRDQAPDLIRQHDLELDNIHVPYYACADLWSDSQPVREDAVALHRSWVDDCARHSIPYLVMHVCLGASTPPPSETGLDSFQRLVGHAEDHGVTLAIENTRESTYISYLLDRIASPSLGLCFDTSHAHLYHAAPNDLLRHYGDRLVTTHLSDTDGRRDQHWLPGLGVVDFDATADAMPEDYLGVYMLECVPADRSQDIGIFLRDSWSALSRTVESLTRSVRRAVS